MTNIDTIATLADSKKTSPADRWAAFQRLAERAMSEDDRKDLALLYQAFAPKPKRKRNLGDFDWAALAAAPKDEARYYLRYVQVSEAGIAVATDGHRMHVANVDKATGYYRPDGTALEDADFKYPDVARVLKPAVTRNTCPLADALDGIILIKGIGRGGKQPGEAYVLRLPGREKRTILNRRYVDDMVSGQPHESVQVGVSEPENDNRPVFFNVTPKRTGVVMAIRDPEGQ
jgi:hypothetical protein